MSALGTDTPAVVVRAADAERLELPHGSTMALLADSTATGGRLSVHQATLVDGADGAGPHHHTTAAEVFYVLDGSAQILVGDRLVVAGAGDFVVVPPGTAHAFAAAPGQTATLLVAVTPGIERFELFRRIARAATGRQPLGTLGHDQSVYDTYADDSHVWRVARSVEAG
jgi:mannose-6-phosphate isomerase-like protein (cupin superfamily)